MAGDINRVTLVGRLTRDPELKHLPSGSAVLEMGLAVNGRKQDASGQWVDKPNFFDVKVFGNQAEMLSQHLAKGRRIGVDGRLDWSSVGVAGRRQALEGRSDRAVRPVPRQPRRRRVRRRSFVPAGAAQSSAAATSRPRPPTTTSPSRRSDDMAQKTPPRKRPSSSSAPGRRKSCHFCKDKVQEVDYKNVNQLRRYISEKGKIRNRRITGACRRHQRQVAVAVKRAREVALLPYVAG